LTKFLKCKFRNIIAKCVVKLGSPHTLVYATKIYVRLCSHIQIQVQCEQIAGGA